MTPTRKKRTRDQAHLRVIAGAQPDHQIAEALDRLINERNLSWEEAEKHLDTLRRHLKRALPKVAQVLREDDFRRAENAIYVLGSLNEPAVNDWLVSMVNDQSLSDDVRLSIMGLLYQRGLAVDEEAFFLSLRDASGAIQRLNERMLDNLSTNLLVRQASVEKAQSHDLAQFAAWLEFIAARKDQRILYILLPLLYLPDEQYVLRVIHTLDQLCYPAAIADLTELAERHPSRRVRQAARATLGRLTMRGSVRPAEQTLPPTPLPPLERAYLTTLDGNGGQIIGVIRRQPNDLLLVSNIVINDQEGVIAFLGSPDVLPNEWQGLQEELLEVGTLPVDVPLSVCRRAYEEARRLNWQAGHPLPLGAEAWRDMLAGDDKPGIAVPLAPTLAPTEAAALLPYTDDLLDTDYFGSWFFDFELLEPFLDKAEGLLENRGDERWDRFVGQVARRLLTNPLREQLCSRLERQAALLAGLGEDELARLTMAAAWGLQPKSPIKPQDHPFLLGMIEAGFDSALEGETEEWTEEDENPYPYWSGPLPRTEAEWRAFIAEAESPLQVMSAWFDQYQPTSIQEINEVAQYIQALWNTTPRPELGGRTPCQAAGVPAPAVPPMPQPSKAAESQPPPGPLTMEDVLQAVDQYYHETMDWEPTLKQSQVEGYLQDLQRRGASPDDLMTRWDDLGLFHFFLDHYSEEVQTLDDLQPYHLSEWMTDFVRRKMIGTLSLAQKKHALETIQSLYAYLAQTGEIQPRTAQAVTEAVTTITAPPRGLRRIARPL